MIDVAQNLDAIVEHVMSGLKDFQKETVKRIDQLYRDGQMRVLVSDEVGLGKTLIAKGVIAKLAQMQKENNDNLVKIVYVCSNSAIAGQNLEKLMISNDVRRENAGASRLSMQHLNIFMQEHDSDLLKQYIQLIPLTPDTSFRMNSNMGIVQERALMYALLRRMPCLKAYDRQLEIAMIGDATSSWNYHKNEYEKKVVECDRNSNGEYLNYMAAKIAEGLNTLRPGGLSYLDMLIHLCQRIKNSGNRKVCDAGIVCLLRIMFAQISLDRLEPDLVIMDEFQRFKYLLQTEADTESEMNMLAKKFFSAESVRILLLSATPYKMYSTLEEIDETQVDAHYTEFMDVMRFLNVTDEKYEAFRTVWNNYSINLKEFSSGDTTILAAKRSAEDALYRHICRTERIAAAQCTDLIDISGAKAEMQIAESDIEAYLQAQRLMEDIHLPYNVPVDYVKSCPYLLSFMNHYKLKRDIQRYFEENPDEISLAKGKWLWLTQKDFARYDPIDPGNARLKQIMEHVFENNAENLLWVPPSRPYYAPGGAFKNAKHFSKTLVFSSWEMVPRMLSMLLSYEAERRTTGQLAKHSRSREARYFHEKGKRFPVARLNFSSNKNAPKAMTLFCLLYPSKFLAQCYDPIDCMNRGLTLEEIEAEIKEKLAVRLQRFLAPNSGTPDHTWYYLTPLLLDGPGYVQTWLDSENGLSEYEDEEESADKKKGFQQHLQKLRELHRELRNAGLNQTMLLGKMPEDLLDVLATMAIASPAICAYRLYQQHAEYSSFHSDLPSQLAQVFINRMNTPESTAVVELCYGQSDDAHWLNVLKYCRDGNLQAVFDEYGHLLTNGLDRDAQLINRLHRNLIRAMKLKTTSYAVDTPENFALRVAGQKDDEVQIRTHFAVSFTKGIGEKDADRKKSVRNAFNSPFRPFVLASTSIGQEGLDFHNYCRRIVHWNLPANPIDLEQREGRINRFECLAIRQNVADCYGYIQFKKNIWAEMFRQANDEKPTGCSDLIPFWGVPEQEGMVQIERIVPMYPFSRDEIAYDRLIKILSLYRLTLGQARQEELVEYISQNFENTENLKDLFINLSPFYKQKGQ